MHKVRVMRLIYITKFKKKKKLETYTILCKKKWGIKDSKVSFLSL